MSETDDVIKARREQKNDPRYVDVPGGASGQQRYLVAEVRPDLVSAYRSATFPDHIQLTHINAEGFTATEEQAAEVWQHLEQQKSQAEQSAAAATPAGSELYHREVHQRELGNHPQAPGKEDAKQT